MFVIIHESPVDFLAAITVADCERTWNFYKTTQKTSVLLIAITDSDCPRLPLNRALMVSKFCSCNHN